MTWGDRDPVGGLEVARTAARLIPGARLEVLPGGHVPYLDNPERVCELLSTFVRSQAMDELDTVDTLIVDLLEWMGPHPRPYAEVLEAWRTSCPRLPVWEDANDRGFIARHRAPGRGTVVSVSAAGVEHLRRHRLPSR